MMYDSPTLAFFGGALELTTDFIGSMDTHFWKGFWVLVIALFTLGIISAIILASIFINLWIGVGIISFFVAIDLISWVGSLFDTQ